MKSSWHNIWAKSYRNVPDEKWKIKSLNPQPNESYTIPIPPPKDIPKSQTTKQKGGKKQKIEQRNLQSELLPCPKMSKINKTMFCISMDSTVNLFALITNQQEKMRTKHKKTFLMVSHTLNNIYEKIELVTGNDSNLIFATTKNHLVVMKYVDGRSNGLKDDIQEVFIKHIPNLITILTVKTRIFALSSTHIYEIDLEDNFKEVCTKRIEFPSQNQQNLYKTLTPVGIVIGDNQSLFYFGSRIEQLVDISKLKGTRGEETQRKVKSEALTIVRISITGQQKIERAKGKVYPIDHVFQVGIFTRSKVYQIEKQTFLVSLHEEVILIKKNFDRYIVWDNVSVVASKSQSKKGQLILADQKILVFSENTEIFAHQIYFNESDSKLSMPPMDNFRGNDDDEKILYDAVLLEYQDSIMKVLAYVTPTSVFYPTNQSNFRRRDIDNSKMKDQSSFLQFKFINISQSDPKKKLQQLITTNKTNQEIELFCKRFDISKQDETKSRWNVSNKQLKDIQNILMQIQEDKFIQTQLDNILKKKSHNLDFLSAVQAKQLSRLNRLLVDKICAYSEPGQEQAEKLLQYILLIMQWYMESEMLLKKITYSKNFLSFKEYDFIEIGKLKAASLKEEIKLLSQKKFEKRLKYFLNSFKILVISNYQQVFGFLLQKKSIGEISEFINEFTFILPQFEEPSPVFINHRKTYGIYSNKDKRQRAVSFAAGPDDELIFKQLAQRSKQREKPKGKSKERQRQKQKPRDKSSLQKHEKQEHCSLWDPLQDLEKQGGKISETMECFEQKIIFELRGISKSEAAKQRTVNNFKKILKIFINNKWFENAAFKQHSMITKTTKQVHAEFKELKRKGAFKIFIKILYKRIEESKDETIESQVNAMLQLFIQKQIIPESFKRNVDARVKVYRNILLNIYNSEKRKVMTQQLPLLSDFVIKSEQKYFDFLFRDIRGLILTKVKQIYEQIQMNFFRERFQMFLQSSLITAGDIIQFVDYFGQEATNDDDNIRIDVFRAIKRLLHLKDKENSQNYIHKCMDRQVLPQNDDLQIDKLRQQAKIPFGYFFYNFFRVFKIDYSYEEFINFTNTPLIKQCKVIQQLISKYCKEQYDTEQDYDHNKVCEIRFHEIEGIQDKIPDVDIHNQPLEFFGLILHLLDALDFQIEEKDVFYLMLQNYLNENKFKELSDFIKKLDQYHVTQNNLHSNNYKMITDFKDELEVNSQFIGYVLGWIKRNYDSIKTLGDLQNKMKANENALKMLLLFSKNSMQIKKEKALFELLTNIRKFDMKSVLVIDQIKKQAESNSSFIFLMNQFNHIGISQFKNYTQRQDWLQAFNNFQQLFLSHKQYAYRQIADPSHPEYIRFLIEVCILMIEENIFPIAKHLITRRIPNDQYYFKDVLLMFLSAVKIDQTRMEQFRQSVKKHILMPETTSIIRQNLQEKILNPFRVNAFVTIKNVPQISEINESRQSQNGSKIQKLDRNDEFVNRSKQMFDMIMSRHRKDDAFFYLIRVKKVYNKQVIQILQKHRSYSYGDEQDRIRQKIEEYSYLLVTSYIKAIELFIQKQFYPTYSFFESKIMILQDARERRDMIKDVNIAISKLDRVVVETESAKKHLKSIKLQLQQSYKAFMSAIGQDPNIRLTDGQGRGLDASKRVQMYSRKTNDLLKNENQQEIEYKKDLQRNLQKVNKIQQDNRINVIQRQISQKITQIKKTNERHALLQAEMKKEDHEESLAARRERELNNIRKQQKEDLQSIKDTYKSNTTKRVNDLIETLRKNREKVAAKRNAPNSAVRDQPRQSNTFKQPNIIIQPPSIRRQSFMPQSPKSQVVSQNLLPITMKGKIDRIQSIREQMKSSVQPKNNILQLQRQMFPEVIEPINPNSKKKANFDDIARLYKQRESEQAYKCIQKYDMLKNPSVRTQLIKRAYTVTLHLQNFIEYLKFLVGLDASWKESIEEKSINIAAQMMKSHNKEKINMKDIIPAQFFTTVVKISLKDYYTHAFDIFKPSIRKIFQKDLMAVHAVGILFRYTLGSENRFYNKVFYEYFKVLIRTYQIKNMDDKQLTLLAQKIRSNYSSLPDNKDQVFEELLMSITNPIKKSRLLEALKRTIDRKVDSMIGGQANKQIAYVLQKLMK